MMAKQLGGGGLNKIGGGEDDGQDKEYLNRYKKKRKLPKTGWNSESGRKTLIVCVLGFVAEGGVGDGKGNVFPVTDFADFKVFSPDLFEQRKVNFELTT